jgi:ABC-type multidrug transport system fused ATPase/permease subunit
MAKLSNIVEKDRSLWSTITFAFLVSLRGSPWYSAGRYLSAVFMSIFMFVEFGALAMVVNEFTRNGVGGANMRVVIVAFALILISTLVPSAISALQGFLADIQINDLQRYLQSLQFKKMQVLDIGTIEQPEFQNLLDVVNTRGWSAVFNIITLMTGSLRNMVALAIAAVSLLVISPLVLMVILISVIPTYILERKNAVRSAELWKHSTESRRMWQAKAGPVNSKNSLIELKNFEIVLVFLEKWTSLISVFHNQAKQLNKKNLTNEVLATLLITTGYGIGFFMIIHQVYIGALLIGTLVYTFAVISRFQSALQALFENFGRLAEHKKNLDAFMDLLDMKPMVISGTRILEPGTFQSLEVQNVSFSYPGSEKTVIEQFSLKISKGENFAIVGLNGAGKTTLIKLLTRVYDPTHGKILVNGIDLKEYHLESWKKCMGILLQDYSIYSEESIAENIMLGDTTKHDQVFVESVAKETTADAYIQELPEKYQQRVGTEFRGGVELSKGQKQKLALARVLYRNAPILILDEPTAAIDALSEDTIFKNLRSNHQHQTRIIISHKFSNVRDADKIILIEHGKIIEQGNHDQLMTIEAGKYKELFNLQAEGYQDKPKRKPRTKKISDEQIVVS